MNTKSICFCLLSFFSITVYSQQPDEKLNQWSLKNPIEKLYLHFDRDEYVSGQTIWLRGYFYSEFNLDDRSSTLYVELLDENSVLHTRKVFPVFNGFSKGQVELPDTLSSGIYIVRAYSPRMLNHDNAYIFKKALMVTGKNKTPLRNQTHAGPLKLEFFPEGGNFINGYLNTIAFKATDSNGYPVEIEGSIMTNKGELVTEFNSIHDGMGSVEIMAEANAGYYAVLANDKSRKFALPETTDRGIAFHIQASDNKLFYEIFQEKDDPLLSPALIVGQMQHKVVFKQQLQKVQTSTTGIISSAEMLSGILQITVFNKDGMPLAERLCFINNGEYIQPAELLIDTLSFKERGKNQFTLGFRDSVAGSFSIAITDPAFDGRQFRNENIYSRLLLTSDLPGYIHNPSWYFQPGNDSIKKAMDLVMMTNGWRRFKWTHLMSQPLPAVKYKDPGYISLKGKVNVFGRDRTVNNKSFLIFVSSGDSSRSMEMTNTNDAGEFVADSLVFYEKSVLHFSELQNKNSKIDITLFQADSLFRTFPLPQIKKNELFPVPVGLPPRDLLNEKLWAEYESMLKSEGLTLSMVTVSSKKRSQLQELEARYATNVFAGNAEKTLDFTNNNDLSSYRNVLDYLQSRVPGLNVIKNGLDYSLFYRNRRTLMGGPIPMVVFLDEMRTSANAVSFVPGYEVAMVKIFSTFVGTDGNGSGGVLAVYTKKGEDLFNSLPKDGAQVGYQGYSIIKEFYSPDYSSPANNNVTSDHRLTLLWNPDIFVNGMNEKIPVQFFNNDRSKSFRVVIEGVTVDGRLLMIEKTITRKAF
jgi:hypothetical protein